MPEMKLALFSSILCVILGSGVIVGGIIAYPYINSSLNSLQETTFNYLNQANTALLRAQEAINSTQVTLIYLSSAVKESIPALETSSQLTDNIANNLTSIGSTVSSIGQTLSSISVLGISPFGTVGNSISSIGQPISATADSLQNVSNSLRSVQRETTRLPGSLDTITLQISNLNNSITELSSSISQAQDSLPQYFNNIRLVVILSIVGLIGLGSIFVLIGISMLSLRHRTIELNKSLYKLYSKYPI